ncbi:hypothetical protein BV97_03962 [Novosphingobium resinovorum]|uniref:DUF2213 domain-containing protein n=1 Tax=Novosphingobium resinovorum TaxID=158500 RepID=A0A031JRE2_9SPHN|nr:DUF2213 domain-containing protein [Novosphingobium resinovorum]EZP79525.1 hypothetical protein BV97_03962 [Novosphingobium resinovorum]
MVMLMDRAPLERVRKLADGRIAAVARFARSGVYQYTGSEVGRPDLSSVNVYRPESEVFDQAAMASFAHKAITVGHPAQAVTADNWSAHSAGWTEGKIARDGEFVEIPLMLADASAVRAYESGEARELSAGYTSELVWGDGVAPDGTRYQATMRQIRGNHIALVAQGRAGSSCRIGDSMHNQGNPNMFTDAERQLFDSEEGRCIIAQAKHSHHLRTAYLGDRAPAFTDAQAMAVVKTAAAQRAGTQQYIDQVRASLPELERRAEEARMRNDPNAWRYR